MNRLVAGSLAIARRVVRRLEGRAGSLAAFSDLERHLWMLADSVRNDAFEKAIARAVKPGMIVADVGTGTGLLAMMACRAGAARVYAIEEAAVITLAEKIVRANGLADRIVLIRGSSLRATLPEKVDVVLSETIGSFVFSEEILSTLVDARERFLEPGGAIVPERIVVTMAPVESFREGTGFWERPVSGFDYREALPHLATGTPVAARRLEAGDYLDHEAVLFDLDFHKATTGMDLHRELEFAARRRGTLHGFVGAWEARLQDDALLRCAPESPALHWPPILFRLPRGVPVNEGDRIDLDFGRLEQTGWQWRWSARVTNPKDA